MQPLLHRLIHLPRTVGSLFGRWWDDFFATQRNEPWYYYLLIAFTYEPFIGVASIVGIVLIARAPAPRPLVMTLPLTVQLVALVLFSLSGGKTPEAAAMILVCAGAGRWPRRGVGCGAAARRLVLA